MNEGHFIRLGDKTTCGGAVTEADPRDLLNGLPRACEGDPVTCGVDGQTYSIEGGISYMMSHGRLVAGTLDSVSGCPCKATLIASVFTSVYGSHRHATGAASPSPGFAPERTRAEEPGFYIVPKSTSREQLESNLFTLRDPAVMGKFKLLNPSLRDVKAGSMIVLGDPNNHQCTREEAMLMEVAAASNQIIETLSPEEADFMVQHRDAIQTFLSHGSAAIGVGASIFKNNLDSVGDALRDIEALQQRTLQRDGHLRCRHFLQSDSACSHSSVVI